MGDKQQIDLEAIRARDADYNDVFEAQASMSKDIAHRLVAWPVADRRALLAYVDALAAEVGSLRARCTEHDQFRHQHRDCDAMGIENHALRARLAEAEATWVYDVTTNEWHEQWGDGAQPSGDLIDSTDAFLTPAPPAPDPAE